MEFCLIFFIISHIIHVWLRCTPVYIHSHTSRLLLEQVIHLNCSLGNSEVRISVLHLKKKRAWVLPHKSIATQNGTQNTTQWNPPPWASLLSSLHDILNLHLAWQTEKHMCTHITIEGILLSWLSQKKYLNCIQQALCRYQLWLSKNNNFLKRLSFIYIQ